MAVLTSSTLGPDTAVEDVITSNPETVRVFMDHDIRCLICGEPIWGTVGEAMEDRRLRPEKRESLLAALRALLPVS